MRQSGAAILNAASVEQMRAIGAALGEALRLVKGLPVIIAIEGELGAGKTTLVGATLNSLGLTGPARSPTYTLIEPYELAGRSIYHIDLYRLTDPAEVEALGVRDLLTADAVFFIEWPERGGDFIPAADLHLSLYYSSAPQTGREVAISARTAAGIQLKAATMGAVKP
jgi:tRNA threonylcarbamoyladenosine biosynthesis protein TsaE